MDGTDATKRTAKQTTKKSAGAKKLAAAKKSAAGKRPVSAKKAADAKGPASRKSHTPRSTSPTEKELLAEDAEALLDAATKGDVEAMRGLAVRYRSGNGVKRDYKLMEQWWEKAAEAGDTTAMWDLGYFHLIGKYLPKDASAALEWFQRASDGGNADAAFQLGLAYEHGQFVAVDVEAARKWLGRAAELGKPEAAHELERIEERDARARRLSARKADRETKAQAAAGQLAAPATSARGSDIVLTHISQRFGKKHVLNDISLTIKGGELIAVVGGSGGGKSTLINIILGSLKPSEGSVRFQGTFGFVPQQNLVHEKLTVTEQLMYYATAVKRLAPEECDDRIATVIDELDLKRSENSIIGKCSGGEKRRTSVACELLSRPDSLLLDEPTSGLDPGDSGDLIDVLRELVHDNDMTSIVINHDYENIKLFDKIIFLAKGQVCFYGTPQRLFDYFDTTSARVIYNLIRTDPDPFIRRFEEWRQNNPDVSGGIQ